MHFLTKLKKNDGYNLKLKKLFFKALEIHCNFPRRMKYIRYYINNDSTDDRKKLRKLSEFLSNRLGKRITVDSETCYHLIFDEDIDVDHFEHRNFNKLKWLLGKNPVKSTLSKNSIFEKAEKENLIEIGTK